MLAGFFCPKRRPVADGKWYDADTKNGSLAAL